VGLKTFSQELSLQNKSLSLNRRLLVLPLLTLLISPDQACALFRVQSHPLHPLVLSMCPTPLLLLVMGHSQAALSSFHERYRGGYYTVVLPLHFGFNFREKVSSDTVIDGGNVVTLSGGNKVRILSIKSSYELSTPSLTIQNLTFTTVD